MASLLIFWAGWTTVWHLLAAVAIGAVVFTISQALLPAADRPWLDWRWSLWMWPYFAGMAALSYLGSFDGRGVLPFGWDMLAVAVFALAIYAYALSRPLPRRIVREYVEEADGKA
jgi:hypothetical protein